MPTPRPKRKRVEPTEDSPEQERKRQSNVPDESEAGTEEGSPPSVKSDKHTAQQASPTKTASMTSASPQVTPSVSPSKQSGPPSPTKSPTAPSASPPKLASSTPASPIKSSPPKSVTNGSSSPAHEDKAAKATALFGGGKSTTWDDVVDEPVSKLQISPTKPIPIDKKDSPDKPDSPGKKEGENKEASKSLVSEQTATALSQNSTIKTVPAFGSGFGGATFGSFAAAAGGSGFGSVSGSTSSFSALLKTAKKDPSPSKDKAKDTEGDEDGDEEDGEGDDGAGDEEDAGGEFTPVTTLEPQKVVTGEEDETTMHQARVKLFHMDEDGQWRERGIGVLKVNGKIEEASKYRLVMRTAAVLKLVLNVRVWKDMPCQVVERRYVRFVSFEGSSKPTTFLAKTPNPQVAETLCDAIVEAASHSK